MTILYKLTPECQQQCLEAAKAILAMLDDSDIHVLVTDKTWTFQLNPNTHRAAMEWLQPNKRCPEQLKTSRAAQKLMLTVFFDTRGLIYHEFLDLGTVITGIVYRNTLSAFYCYHGNSPA